MSGKYFTAPGHSATTSRFSRGMTPIRPSRPVYGTRVRCECGWGWKTNEAPSKGGSQECKVAWKEHVARMRSEEEHRAREFDAKTGEGER